MTLTTDPTPITLPLSLSLSLSLSLTLTLTGVWDNVKKMGDLYGMVKEGITQAHTQGSKPSTSFLPSLLTHSLTCLLAPRSRATPGRRRATRRRPWSTTRCGTRPASRGRTTPPPSSSSSGRRPPPPPPPPPPQGQTHSPSLRLPLKWSVAASALSRLNPSVARWVLGRTPLGPGLPPYSTRRRDAGLLWAPAY